MLARFAFDTPDQLVSGILRCPGSLVHLRSMVASMNQKPSVDQTTKSVRWVLTSDTGFDHNHPSPTRSRPT